VGSELAGKQWGAAIRPTTDQTGHASVRAAPSPDEVREQVDRILRSPALRASPRRRAFLRYVVEETLAGRAAALKGTAVAQAVFGRDDTFDQQADPVVRIEARRLRRDLDGYYIDAGSIDPLRITIPKGGYVPHFEWWQNAGLPPARQPEAAAFEPPPAVTPAPVADAPAVSGGRSRGYLRGMPAWAALLAVVLFAAAAVGLWLRFDRVPPGDEALGPSVIVLPFEPLGSTDD
jgi:hypothetical protein